MAVNPDRFKRAPSALSISAFPLLSIFGLKSLAKYPLTDMLRSTEITILQVGFPCRNVFSLWLTTHPLKPLAYPC